MKVEERVVKEEEEEEKEVRAMKEVIRGGGGGVGDVAEARPPSLALGNEADPHGASTRERTSLYLHSRKFPEHQRKDCKKSLFLEWSKIPYSRSVATSGGTGQTIKLLIYGPACTRQFTRVLIIGLQVDSICSHVALIYLSQNPKATNTSFILHQCFF